MVLRLAILAWLGSLALAGPIAWDDSKCAQKCNGGTKYQYSEQTSYIYLFESSNEMKADGASDLSMNMKATVKLTAVSKCEMVLQITDVTLQHGPLQETSSSFIDELKRNPLPFSWDDGRIEHVCPSPDDSNDANNVKKAILSALQNSMRSFEVDLFDKEVDVLGKCDTEYKVKSNKNEKFVLMKEKNIATCTDHLKHKSLLLASFYESSSQRQHLPLLTGETLSCRQTIDGGIVDEVICEEKSAYKPLSDYGYVVEAQGKISLKKQSSEPATSIRYQTPNKESLVYQYSPELRKDESLAEEARNVLKKICENSEGLINKESANSMHRLVYLIRSLSEQTLEGIYTSLKNKELCRSGKTLTVFLDALKVASSGGSIGLLTKLFTNGEINVRESKLWFTLMPFTSYVEEGSIAATIPLLKKESAQKQALLGVSALAYKYCSHDKCKDSAAVKGVSSSLKQFLGDKCQTANEEEESRIITALKAFGNLGYIGESADAIFECANLPTNKISVRISAIEAFRRTPCSENIISKVLEIYKNKNEDDEIRIASLISLSRCATVEVLRQVYEVYEKETSKQVEVFTWSYLENLESTFNPIKSKLDGNLKRFSVKDIKTPSSTDITKFSRNFQSSLFSELLNIGHDAEANIVHSRNSYLPRSADLGLKVDVFGNELDLFQIGGRAEDLEHLLEQVFGPHGLLPNVDLDKVLTTLTNIPGSYFGLRRRRSADSYKAKIEALSERLGFSRGKSPHGSAYFRVLGHELGWVHLHKDMFQKYEEFDLDEIIRNIANTRSIDIARNLLFLDFAVLFPSVTGRAYKLSANASLIFGLKTEGKLNIEKDTPRIDFEALVQPSILNDMTASFTIHSENFEPGVKVESTLQGGLDFDAKFEVKGARLLHLKLNRRQDKLEILSLKRTIFSMSHKGEVENPKPKSYQLNYCTKYLQHFLGVRYCASASIPHIYNDQGKPKIPFVRAMEASIVAEKTDGQMQGYELMLKLPDDFTANERTYKFLLDTPNSVVDRKLSLDLTVKHPSEGAKTYALKIYNPFYSLDIDVDRQNSDSAYKLKIDALAAKKRQYSLQLDVGKNIKGARLVEYQPKLSLSLHNMKPIEITGTVVFQRGRKDQIAINLESSSFDSPFIIKGNIMKEGVDIIDLEKDYKIQSDIDITAFSQIHRLHSSIGNKEGKGVFLTLGHHFEPDGKAYESVTVSAKIENIELRDRLQFDFESKILLAEHQDLNSMLKWYFSLKPFAHIKNDISFRYGENFEDEKHVVRFVHFGALSGDFDTFQKLDIENKIGLTVSCFDFDKSAALSVVYDLVDKPKFLIEAGIKSRKDSEISIIYDYEHITNKPLKLQASGKFVYNTYTFRYKDDVNEVSPNVYEGKAVFEPEGKEIKVDYVYKIKSKENLHHEFDGTIHFPSKPVSVKAELELSSEVFKFNSVADTGESPYSLDINLKKTGTSEINLQTPYIDGNAAVESESNSHSIRADIKSKGRDDRRVVVTGNVAQGDINTLTLDISWDADNDAQKKISIKAKSNKEIEDGIEKHMITAAITYVGSINVDVTGKISTNFVRGPHFFKAEFSGNMEPMAIEFTHDVKEGHSTSVLRYLRSNVEKLRLDMKGKYILTGYKFETEYGLFLSSPYKTFDGKELFFRIMADSNDATRNFIAEYRIKPAAVIGYVGKIDYVRKRGFPGHIKSNLLVTVHQRPVYEGSTAIDYGNGKYSWKSSFTPISKKKISLVTSFEHAGKFAAFHHSMAASLKYLQKVELIAVADLRNLEDAKVHSNFDINQYKLYDVNSTLKMKSVIDFDSQVVILSKITPSLRIFSKAQTSGQLTKYEANLEVDSVNLITGSGEMKKRKKGFNGDMIFKYKDKELLALTLNQEAKSKTERNYVIKTKTPWRTTQSNIKIIREKKGSVKYETKFCKNDEESCISIDAHHKEAGDMNEWQISYKRGDVDFSIERIRVSSADLSRFQTVLYKGDKRYGYDLRVAKEENGRSISVGFILPSREIVTKTYAEFSLQKPRIKFDFQADARKHPDRKMTVDIRFENHLLDNKASKLDVIITHPIYEKPIELQLVGDYQPNSNKFLLAQMSADYSNDPEDKMIGKLSLEYSKGSNAQALLNVYHKDDKNLDFVIKLNGTVDDDQEYLGLFWNWKDESDADAQAYTVFHYLEKEKRFYFDYNRPKFVYRLDGAIVTPSTLLGETCEVDLTSVYNGETTKGKLITDYNTNCYKLVIFNKEGENKRIIEVCFNEKSRKIASILMESLDEEGQWTFDYSLDVVRKSWRTLQIKQNFNPEFLGSFLFHMTSFGDELTAAGVGTLPMYNSPRFKKIRNAFHSKIFQPSLRFFLPEVAKFIADLRRDVIYAVATLKNYYNTLPDLNEIKHCLERASSFIQSGLKEVWLAVESYYKEALKDVIAVVDRATGIVKAMCDSNQDCKALVKSFREEGLDGLCKQIQNIILSIPNRIEEFMSRPSIDARKYFDRVMTVVKALLRPLTKWECGEIVVKLVQLGYSSVEPHIQSFLENYPQYYRQARDAILGNTYVIQARKMVRETYLKVKDEVKKIDFNRLYALAKKQVEEYLFRLSPPTVRSGFTVNTINTEKGIIDIDIHFGLSQTLPLKIIGKMIDKGFDIVTDVVSDPHRYGWNMILVKVKRIADFNFFPPYAAQAMIVGNHHFVTFDKHFYDFAGECTYLLSRDFQDGNFTFALKPKEGDKDNVVLTLINDVSIEVNKADKTVLISDNPVELPYISKDFIVSLSGSTIIVDDKHGVKVQCSLVHKICTFTISGWYFGKTAGLLGTYNYESSDEFKRPKGQVANSAAVMAKSWELKKGCKSNNLLVGAPENHEFAKICKAHFEERTSPLAACFYEVDPKEYYHLCLSHISRSSDSTKALCDVSVAYVTECERNYVELSLPSKCLTCTAPNGSPLQHGDRKKFENLSKKTADVIFIVEDHSCNKALVGDLANLAKSVERELQNDGFKDTMFGVVGFGGDVGSPQVYTVKGNTFFNSRDVNAIKDRLKLESNKVESSRAFEAMKLAVKYIFRSDAAKSFVLLSCSACKYDYKSLQYPVVQQILLERGISLHVIGSAEIAVRKSKEKNIIGVDPDTAYHSKDVTQQDLVGEPALRSQVILPKDLCISLSQDVDGSYFSTYPLSKASSSDTKNWRSVFSRKFLKAVQNFQCQWCDCTSTRDHIPNTVCQPCHIKRPRLPFSVCKSCALPRTVESFLSYIRLILRN